MLEQRVHELNLSEMKVSKLRETLGTSKKISGKDSVNENTIMRTPRREPGERSENESTEHSLQY